MGLLIRTLLIWLLVLAVPAQGAAAATMAFCGPNHHGGGVATAVELAAPASHAHHDGAVGAEPLHPQAHAQAQADEGSSASAVSAKGTDATKHKCSACSSCCSMGAIFSSLPVVPAPVFTPTVFSALVPSVDTFAADSPERPPRIVLA